jgi:hypothetical protein
MSDSAKTYSVQGFTIVHALFANINAGGAAEDGLLEIEPVAPDFEFTTGADGSGVFSETGNKSYNVTVKLLQTSPVNTVLAALLAVDKATLAGLGPFLFKNDLGNDLLMGTAARIVASPKTEVGKTVGTKEWKLVVTDATYFPGGS